MNTELFSLLARLGVAFAASTPSGDLAASTSTVPAPAAAAPLPSADPTVGESERRAIRVRVFKVAGGSPLFARLVAELRAQGFEVTGEPDPLADSGDTPEAVGAEVRAALEQTGNAEAVLALASTPLVIRIWIANAVTGRQLFREVQREQNTLPDTAIVALWAVELLRATGFAADAQKPDPPPVQQVQPAPPKHPSAVAPPAAPSSSEKLTLHLGPALLLSPGGLPPTFSVALGAHWQPGKHFGLETEWLVPASSQALKRAEGAALVSLTLGTLGGFFAFGARDAGWSGQLGGGVAIAWLTASGTDAQQPLAARTDHALAAGPYLRTSLAHPVASRFCVRLDLLSGAALPRPVIAFGNAEVAHWGQPWALAQATAEVAF